MEAFKDADESKMNKVLDELPLNQKEADEWNDAGQKFSWANCPMRMTAGYYANNKVLEGGFPVPEIPELQALLDGKEKATS